MRKYKLKLTPWKLPVIIKDLETRWSAILFVIDVHYMPIEPFIGSGRAMEYVYLRQMLAYWIRKVEYPETKLTPIARLLGLTDHSTALHMIDEYTLRLAHDDDSLYRFTRITPLGRTVREDFEKFKSLVGKSRHQTLHK